MQVVWAGCGEDFTALHTSNGHVLCFGENTEGQCAQGSGSADLFTQPETIGTLRPAIVVAVGAAHVVTIVQPPPRASSSPGEQQGTQHCQGQRQHSHRREHDGSPHCVKDGTSMAEINVAHAKHALRIQALRKPLYELSDRTARRRELGQQQQAASEETEQGHRSIELAYLDPLSPTESSSPPAAPSPISHPSLSSSPNQHSSPQQYVGARITNAEGGTGRTGVGAVAAAGGAGGGAAGAAKHGQAASIGQTWKSARDLIGHSEKKPTRRRLSEEDLPLHEVRRLEAQRREVERRDARVRAILDSLANRHAAKVCWLLVAISGCIASLRDFAFWPRCQTSLCLLESTPFLAHPPLRIPSILLCYS